MKVKCRYADCLLGGEIDTDRDGYFFDGTGKYKSFYHSSCAKANTPINVPLKIGQVRELKKIITDYYENHSYKDSREDLELCLILDTYD